MKAELIRDADLSGKKIFIKQFNDKYFSHPFHFHQFCELTWIKYGQGKIIIGDYIGTFSSGELILIGEALPHLWRCDENLYHQNSTLNTISTSIYFSSTLIENLTGDPDIRRQNLDLMHKAQRGLRIFGEDAEMLKALIKQAADTDGLNQLSTFLKIADLILKTDSYELLAGLSYKNICDEKDMDRFNNVYQFLLKNFDRDIMLDEVSEICRLTPGAFCRYFKARTQKSFSRFLNEIRIGHACKLLREETGSIKNICYQCGYNNPVNFFRFFKMIVGMTPRTYRNRLHNANKAVPAFKVL